MAEAHAAVAFSFQVTPEGVDVQISQDAIRAVYFSGVRSWRKRIIRFVNRFHTGVYPAKFSSLGIFLTVLLTASTFGHDITYGFSGKLYAKLFARLTTTRLIQFSESLPSHVSAPDALAKTIGEKMCKANPRCDDSSSTHTTIHIQQPDKRPSALTVTLSKMLAGTIMWLCVVFIIRYLLKGLLCYQGWMFDERGKMSILTKMWAVGIKVLGGSHPQLNSYQASLPRLPVPPLDDTIARYLRSVRPLLDDEKFAEMKKLSEEFSSTIGPTLQWYLKLKSWWASNYVSDWWEQYIYLAGRGPIMVNSNYYGMDLLYHVPSRRQTSRAAFIAHTMFSFRSNMDKEKMKPIMANGMIPLCSAQNERMFNTCRVPGIEVDVLQHYMDCRHICVFHRGRYYKVTCYKNGTLLSPSEIEIQLDRILEDGSPPSNGEHHLAALTAGERVPWAKMRNAHFREGVNARSLHAIEKSAFLIVLDDEEYEVDPDATNTGLSDMCRSLLHGKCYDRWFDKSFNVVVFANGRWGVNAEHSWADAPIVGYLVEYVLGIEHLTRPYNPDGRCKDEPTQEPIPPFRLRWDLPTECIATIESSLASARSLADDVHLHVSPFKHFGKGLVKKFRMSPDAFIQAALQLAHLRDKGHFALTYEASMTRLFREGRTETVRSCTSEMCAFARCMESADSSVEERHQLLQAAADRHTMMYKEAMTGKGIDRHLFCLYVVSKYKKVESSFLQKVLREPWRLSTSQTPHQQAMIVDLKENPSCLSGGGGFGPVADDGYGVSYIICHEDLVMFHISSKKSSLETDSARFNANIEQAMLDIRDVCEAMRKSK